MIMHSTETMRPPPETGTPATGYAPSEFTENVLPALHEWVQERAKTALVTVVGIEGGAPRPIGAQMAVAQDGRAVGYISGGCLEGALVAEAQLAIAEGRNRLVRYGSGSPYIDVRLPCGSGLDIYVDQDLPAHRISKMHTLWRQRQPFCTVSDMAAGTTVLGPVTGLYGNAKSCRDGNRFTRIYWPQLRLVIVGAGPAAGYLARLAADLGWQVELYAPDTAGLGVKPHPGIAVNQLYAADLAAPLTGDAWSAGAVVFHDHEWEIPVLSVLLKTDCFYIGAVGSRKVHGLRLDALREQGFDEQALGRIHGPAGLIGQTKSPATLAVSILAEIVAAARAKDITP